MNRLTAADRTSLRSAARAQEDTARALHALVMELKESRRASWRELGEVLGLSHAALSRQCEWGSQVRVIRLDIYSTARWIRG